MTADTVPGPGQVGRAVPADLADLRGRLDSIDRRLLDALRDRLACCVDIAHRKRRHGIPMMNPGRIEHVHHRAAEYGREHGIDQGFLRRLYDVVIAETCRLEDLVIGTPGPADVTSALPPAPPADPRKTH